MQPLRAATECEVDLVRERLDHGNGLRPWIPKQWPEFHLCATESPLDPDLPMWGLIMKNAVDNRVNLCKVGCDRIGMVLQWQGFIENRILEE